MAFLLFIDEVEARFDTVKPHVDLRLHRLATQIIGSEIVDVFSYLDELPGVLRKDCLDLGLSFLQGLQYFIIQFVGNFRHV